ncbi:hypothetical protein KBB25_03285 [Candidatus Gracilibacteria bacterium]|nr:hypothetical protein [Candidatus Gracilibacteria bacterium]
MSLTQEKIKRLKKLTALESDKSIDIDSVVDSFDMLSKMNVDLTRESARSGKGSLITRKDEIHLSSTTPDELLSCTSQRVIGHQIALGSIMHGE